MTANIKETTGQQAGTQEASPRKGVPGGSVEVNAKFGSLPQPAEDPGPVPRSTWYHAAAHLVRRENPPDSVTKAVVIAPAAFVSHLLLVSVNTLFPSAGLPPCKCAERHAIASVAVGSAWQ